MGVRVIVYNRLPEGHLDHFLFRRARLDAVRLRLALFELQNGRCFYTDRPLRPNEADVDHFVPWSRSPLNAIENLIVADRRINNNKRDHLASAEHVAAVVGPPNRGAAELEMVAAPTAGRAPRLRRSASHVPSTSRLPRRTCCGCRSGRLRPRRSAAPPGRPGGVTATMVLSCHRYM